VYNFSTSDGAKVTGPKRPLTVRNFQVSNFGKLYRSCGNCSTQYRRTVVFQNIKATAPGTSNVTPSGAGPSRHGPAPLAVSSRGDAQQHRAAVGQGG
jgi:hypothetical protein